MRKFTTEIVTVHVDGRSIAVPARSTAAVAVLLADKACTNVSFRRAACPVLRHGDMFRMSCGNRWSEARAELPGVVRTRDEDQIAWMRSHNSDAMWRL